MVTYFSVFPYPPALYSYIHMEYTSPAVLCESSIQGLINSYASFIQESR